VTLVWIGDSVAFACGRGADGLGETCEAAWMASRPSSRREACREEREELCVRLGYGGGDERWLLPSDLDGETADAVVDAVLVAEEA